MQPKPTVTAIIQHTQRHKRVLPTLGSLYPHTRQIFVVDTTGQPPPPAVRKLHEVVWVNASDVVKGTDEIIRLVVNPQRNGRGAVTIDPVADFFLTCQSGVKVDANPLWNNLYLLERQLGGMLSDRSGWAVWSPDELFKVRGRRNLVAAHRLSQRSPWRTVNPKTLIGLWREALEHLQPEPLPPPEEAFYVNRGRSYR